MLWPFLALIFVIIVSLCGISAYTKKDKSQNQKETYMLETINDRPKIGAEVSTSFYTEVKAYCSKHSMTISDLIRSAVKTYMDMNE